jgi:hypothetical protein
MLIIILRLASMTHSTDTDQRSVGLTFVQHPYINHHTWSVTAPADADIAPPGYYMLFVLRDKSHSSSGTTMIPSEAKIVRLS